MLTLMMFMDMFSIVILSLLIQAWATQSEEAREARLAHMRDHTAEVEIHAWSFGKIKSLSIF